MQKFSQEGMRDSFEVAVEASKVIEKKSCKHFSSK